MGELLIKPYEISVWEDKLTQDGFIEQKLAVIGSDTMGGPNKAYDPVFHKKANGEKTLSFSLKYKYFDPYSGNEEVINPFTALLTNERKVKLKYDGQWYEFIVKDHTESSEEYTWTYTCTDAFVLELSKNGYNLEFSADLNNNQGTARELAKKVLEDTDWRLGGADVGKQLVEEPIYKATLLNADKVHIINASGTTMDVPSTNAQVYVFYSYVKNQNGKFVQFISQEQDNYEIDDKNVITATNFRIQEDLTFEDNQFKFRDDVILQIGEAETRYKANRLAYNQLTTYDPVMQRTVDRFRLGNKDTGREVYRYTDYTYTTSNVVMNFISNGENFNALEDGTLQGWNPYVGKSNKTAPSNPIKKLELVTNPEIKTGKKLVDINALSQIEGFMKVHFYGSLTEDYENAVFNDGISHNTAFINSISQGEQFLFRWRAGKGTIDEMESVNNLRLIVAKYSQDAPGWGYYYKYLDPENIILEFVPTEEHPVTELNNVITGGEIRNTESGQVYYIDDVAQAISTKYLYESGGAQYYWDVENNEFRVKDNLYRPYYYLVTKAKRAVPNTVLTDPTEKIGIFIYQVDDNTEGDYFIQDIQLTRYVSDANGEPIIMGNVPTATANPTEYYYVKPDVGTDADTVITYTSPQELIAEIGEQGDELFALYNESSEKNLSISASQSNCFNILQTIAETFECWINLVVEHDDTGAIVVDKYDSDGNLITNVEEAKKPITCKPRKYVYLNEYAGKDNWAGFKYAVNLSSIERNVNSDEIVTKLIVDQAQSEYADEGFVSIANAKSNPSGESYILNFDYYYGQGLLDRDEAEKDKTELTNRVSAINSDIQEKETRRRELEAALTALGSKRNVYTELVSSAQDMQSRALADFQDLTHESYEEYKQNHDNLIKPTGDEEQDEANKNKQLTEEQTLLDIIGEIYASSATINNYSGVLINVNKEYWEVREELKGRENYKVAVWVDRDEQNARHVFVELNDYLEGFKSIVNGSEYEVTVSVKYFDITTDATEITFIPPSTEGKSYTINGESEFTYQINDNKVVKFQIACAETKPGIEDQIDGLIDDKKNIIKDFNNKYRRFIQEGTWNATDYIDSELYYLDALQVSNTSAFPAISYTINVVEISQLEDYENYLFDAGDKTYVEDTEFFGWANKGGVLTPAREEVIVSEVEWHLDEPDQNIITVQNYKTRFEDFFQRVNAAVQTVQYNEATYAKISSLMDADGKINQDVLVQSLNQIAGQKYNLTSDGSVLIDGDHILVQNLNNSANRVIINSEGIKVSSDGGQSWATAIDGRGINIGTVYTGKLNTNSVVIGSDSNPSFRWDKSGISAYKSNNQDYIRTSDTVIVPTKQYYTYDENTGTYEAVETPRTEDLENYYEYTAAYDLQTYVRYDEYGLYGVKEGGRFKAQSLDDVKEKAHFAVTWDGFFIKNSYPGGGRVEITSDNDFRVMNIPEGKTEEQEKVKIGALEWGKGITSPDAAGASEKPTLYGIRIQNDDGDVVMKTGDDGNLEVTGTINANAGNFDGLVTVGKDDDPQSTKPYIEIDGRSANDATIRSSRYTQDGASYGWMINADGDAVFNNITARGAIKTAVFEYAEIQAVGGIFIFRPSSTIRTAEINNNDLILTLEKPHLFQAGDWCKISNYLDENQTDDARINNILLTNGLTHVYEVIEANGKVVKLSGAATMVQGAHAVTDLASLEGGALINMGNKANGDGEVGTSNYGIGVNSSDNTVNLPRRAISLFETVIDETKEPKVSYNYRGILGTLPYLPYEGDEKQVDSLYHEHMEGTQGIYTDNMYIGDDNQYVAFYEDSNGKQLKIKASQIMFEVSDPAPGEDPWKDVADVTQGADGEDAIYVMIDSTGGNFFNRGQIQTSLIAHVYQGSEEITNQFNTFNWYRRLPNGRRDPSWTTQETSNQLDLNTADVDERAVFVCEVVIN